MSNKNFVLCALLFITIIISVSLIDFTDVRADEIWLRQSTPTTKWLFKVDFFDSLYGWAVGDSGIILHTSNGGVNWVKQQSGIDYFIEDIFFLNREVGWGIANDFYYYGTTILRTTNSGQNWTHYRYPDTTIVLSSIQFLDSINAYMVGYQGIILKTTNAGLNWARCDLDTSFFVTFPIKAVKFYSQYFGIACGGAMDIAGVVWRTTDGGGIWTSMGIAAEPFNDLKFFDSLNIICVGGDFEFGATIAVSTDAGKTWAPISLDIFGASQSISSRTSTEHWIALGFSQRWALTTNNGKEWYEVTTPDSSAIYGVEFISPHQGWAVGTYGSIYKYNYNLIGINPINNLNPLTAKLYQNYPNPFNPNTTIEYELSRTAIVSIKVYDLLGREVGIILNDIRKAGRYSVTPSLDNQASGVYFYKMEIIDLSSKAVIYSESKKMFLVK